MKLSVLISTYNRRDALLRTLDALLAQSYPLSKISVTVLDDCGSDGTSQLLTERRADYLSRGLADFRVLRNVENNGIARNRGLLTRYAGDAETILYLDDDVYLADDTIERLKHCLLVNTRCAAVGPRLVYEADRSRTAHCANFVGKWSGRYGELDASVDTPCDWLNSSCLMVRAAAAAAVDYADGFYTAHEEVDFCLQLRRSGWDIVYCPGALAVHDLPLSGAGRRGRLYYLYRNKLLLFRRNFPTAQRLTASLVTVLLGLPSYLVESLRYNRGVNMSEIVLILRAVRDGLAGRDGRL